MDLLHSDYNSILPQVVQLAREIRDAAIVLDVGVQDEIRWTICALGQYSAQSAYNAHFRDQPATSFRAAIWKIWALGKIKMFLWMLHLDRLWCNDRL